MTSPPGEAELWNGELGQKWASNARDFDQMLKVLNPLVLEAADLSTAKNVLDIGCGSGAMALEAARRVGAKAQIEGVDISQTLVETARGRANQAPNVRFSLSDMDAYHAPVRFDRALSRLGVMFFSDPVASFARIRKLLTSDGKLVFVCWQALAANQWASLPYETALGFLDEPPSRPPPGTPGPFALADKQWIADILSQSGWKNTQINSWNGTLTLPGDTLEETAQFAVKFGPAARLSQNHDIDQAQLLKALLTRWHELGLQDGETKLSAAAWQVQASPQ